MTTTFAEPSFSRELNLDVRGSSAGTCPKRTWRKLGASTCIPRTIRQTVKGVAKIRPIGPTRSKTVLRRRRQQVTIRYRKCPCHDWPYLDGGGLSCPSRARHLCGPAFLSETSRIRPACLCAQRRLHPLRRLPDHKPESVRSPVPLRVGEG
jgi:hypothetical protein